MPKHAQGPTLALQLIIHIQILLDALIVESPLLVNLFMLVGGAISWKSSK